MCCVVQPSSVGFNMADVEVILNLPKEVCGCELVGRRIGWMGRQEFICVIVMTFRSKDWCIFSLCRL